LVIGSTGTGSSWLWLAFYVAIACSTVAVPILAFVAAPGRLEDVLERLRQWIDRRHAVLTAVILAVIGLVLLYQGIRAV
jgi:threonine/homoserine/homoserine lactone efflux protein